MKKGICVLNIFEYDRMMIVGNNGSGKSFFSRELATITGFPLVHLDVEFWRLHWEMPTREEWVRRQRELASAEKWIIEGNHTDTMELRFQRADIVLFLDVNRLVCLAGLVGRIGNKRSDMPAYLEEKFDKGFLKLCKGAWTFSKTRKRAIFALHKAYAGKPFLMIRGRRGMKALLRQWKDQKKGR